MCAAAAPAVCLHTSAAQSCPCSRDLSTREVECCSVRCFVRAGSFSYSPPASVCHPCCSDLPRSSTANQALVKWSLRWQRLLALRAPAAQTARLGKLQAWATQPQRAAAEGLTAAVGCPPCDLRAGALRAHVRQSMRCRCGAGGSWRAPAQHLLASMLGCICCLCAWGGLIARPWFGVILRYLLQSSAFLAGTVRCICCSHVRERGQHLLLTCLRARSACVL